MYYQIYFGGEITRLAGDGGDCLSWNTTSIAHFAKKRRCLWNFTSKVPLDQLRESLGKEEQKWAQSCTHKHEKISGIQCSPSWELAEAKCAVLQFQLRALDACAGSSPADSSRSSWEAGAGWDGLCHHLADSAIQQAQWLRDSAMGSLGLSNYSHSSALAFCSQSSCECLGLALASRNKNSKAKIQEPAQSWTRSCEMLATGTLIFVRSGARVPKNHQPTQ